MLQMLLNPKSSTKMVIMKVVKKTDILELKRLLELTISAFRSVNRNNMQDMQNLLKMIMSIIVKKVAVISLLDIKDQLRFIAITGQLPLLLLAESIDYACDDNVLIRVIDVFPNDFFRFRRKRNRHFCFRLSETSLPISSS